MREGVPHSSKETDAIRGDLRLDGVLVHPKRASSPWGETSGSSPAGPPLPYDSGLKVTLRKQGARAPCLLASEWWHESEPVRGRGGVTLADRPALTPPFRSSCVHLTWVSSRAISARPRSVPRRSASRSSDPSELIPKALSMPTRSSRVAASICSSVSLSSSLKPP